MEVSVIIPTLNEGEYVGKTLECLRKQTFGDFEIIIVDGGSKDKTKDIASNYTDRIFVLKERGVSRARNYGAEKARGKILAMTDADTVIPISWLEKIQRNIQKNNLDMVYGPVYYTSDVTLAMKITTGLFWKFHRFVWRRTPFTMNPNLAFTRGGFKKVSGYRTDIHFMDDYDIGCRSRGLEFYFDHDNPVIFSARRYRTLRSYVFDIPKTLRGFYEYHFTNSTSGNYIPIR